MTGRSDCCFSESPGSRRDFHFRKRRYGLNFQNRWGVEFNSGVVDLDVVDKRKRMETVYELATGSFSLGFTGFPRQRP